MNGEAINREPIVLISNFDGFFPTRPNGTFAKKCRRLGPRTIHLADPEDTVVLYEPPSATYTTYLEELYEGHLPCVLAPRQAQNPLDLVDDIARDETLAQRLKACDRLLPGMHCGERQEDVVQMLVGVTSKGEFESDGWHLL